jgi:rhodanese-related sulfurtransferase
MGLRVISPARLHQLLTRREPLTVIDVNPPQSWASRRVPGAVNLDHAAYGAADLPQNRDAMLVFYCSGRLCRKAPSAARRAQDMGYRNVQVMSAGISGWLHAGLPTDGSEGTIA